MEYLDTYDENKNYLGKQLRSYVHENGLWHNTVHCWLYNTLGYVYFQIRKDENKLYTTASGHVKAGESLKEAFGREIKEEIGVDLKYNDAIFAYERIFTMDKKNNLYKDRAFTNVYIYEYKGQINEFSFDKDEVSGLVKVNVNDALDLFCGKVAIINCHRIETINNVNTQTSCIIDINDFLIFNGETGMSKYGDVLKVIKKQLNI